jgi:hypothetical protein
MKRIFLLAFFIFIFQNVQAENQRLSEAYENEIIEKVKGVFQARGIEEKEERPICATSVFLEIKDNWDRFSAKTKVILESYTRRPSFNFPEHTRDTPHFRIHYVTEGDSAVPNEDWVNTCSQVLEHVWDTEIGHLGYNPPPSDSIYPDTIDNGGDGRYDVYLVDLSSLYLGYTDPEYFISLPSGSATSYIVLDNDYVNYISIHSKIEWLEVTFAHEFFHAIQMGYDETEPQYWMEMSAVWMEDMVYDDINDYRGYLSSFFNHPDWSLKTFTNDPNAPRDELCHAYGSCVWPIYLSERKYPSKPEGFDTTIIRDIWEKCAEVPGNNVIDPPSSDGKSATDKALEARGSNFDEAFREFTVWNYFTANRAIPQLFYSEGDQFSYLGTPIMVRVDAVHTAYPVSVTSIPYHPQNLGSNYVVFVPDPGLKEGGIKMDFVGRSGEYEVSAVGYNPGHLEPFDTPFLINPGYQTGTGKVCDWNLYTEVIMIPAVITRTPNYSFIYEYSADYDSSYSAKYDSSCSGFLPEKDEILQNFPNPFVIEKESDRAYFPFVLSLPSRVRIDILTLSGERIKTISPKNDPKLEIGEYLANNLAMVWDGKNEKGEYVASGIYLYRFRTDRTTVIKKMAVIR